MQKISYINLKELNIEEEAVVKKLTGEHLAKLEKFVKGSFVLKIKKHSVGGKRVRYSFHLRLNAPSVIAKVESTDWDLKKALHIVFTEMGNELKHKFKLDGKKWK